LRSSGFRLQFDDILPVALARNGFPAVAIFGMVTAPEPDDYDLWANKRTSDIRPKARMVAIRRSGKT
jgi:hypothetical protein